MENALIHTVPLEEDEAIFIERKYHKNKEQFWSVLKTLIVLGILVPALTFVTFKTMRYGLGKDENFPNYYFLISLGSLLFLIFISAWYSYFKTLKQEGRDFKEKLKIIERTYILRKVFIKNTHTCHFFLTSTVQMSIEVSTRDYKKYKIGDEINIEYSKYAKEYFGYF